MVLYKTQSEFQQQNIEASELPEGVLAFAEPYRDRMVLPIDEPSDALYRLITHELTHIFEFDIIPRSLLRRGLPLWVDEGLADYMTGYWNPFDLMTVRDAAVSDNVPSMSNFQGVAFQDGRLPYNLGHAAFEFIESKWGKEGLRQFLFALRKAVIGGGESAYEEAFRLKAEEFDEQFEKYLKDRFKPFRDKERPADYGRNLAPKRDKTPYSVVLSIEPSPSGELMAVAAGNRKDQELDIVLMSTKDGKVTGNLTSGFNKDRGYEYIVTPGGFRNNAVPWMSWAPGGDRIAYFVRTEKHKTLVLQNVVTKKVDKRIELKNVDMPESPDISPDGRHVAFAALSGAVGDIFIVDVETGELKNVTNDQFGDFAPTYAPDGKSLVYLARVSGNDKLFRLDLASGKKTQITFGTHDDGGAQFIDADTLVFSSTATDPNTAIEPEVARNGNIYNIWTLNMKTGELRQFTDTLTANVSPVVLRDQKTPRIAFVTYYKGEYGIHTLSRDQALHVVAELRLRRARTGHRLPAAAHVPLVKANVRTKGTLREDVPRGTPAGERRRHQRRRRLRRHAGDLHRRARRQAVQRLRGLGLAVPDDGRLVREPLAPLPVRAAGLLTDAVLLRLSAGRSSSPTTTRISIATRRSPHETSRGATAFGIYPLNRYARLEFSAGLHAVQTGIHGRRPAAAGRRVPGGDLRQSRSSTAAPSRRSASSFVQETTVFREYGPLAGNTVRLGYEFAPSGGGLLGRQTADVDARYYMRLATNGVLAFRARGFKSWGDFPGYLYFGGNSEMRGYDYLQFIGNKAFFANAEAAVPADRGGADTARRGRRSPRRVLRELRCCGVRRNPDDRLDVERQVDHAAARVRQRPAVTDRGLAGVRARDDHLRLQTRRQPRLIRRRARNVRARVPDSLRLVVAYAFNRDWENFVFAYEGLSEGMSGSDWLRRPRFSLWIGYDF